MGPNPRVYIPAPPTLRSNQSLPREALPLTWAVVSASETSDRIGAIVTLVTVLSLGVRCQFRPISEDTGPWNGCQRMFGDGGYKPCLPKPNNRFTSPLMTENQNDPLGQMQAAMKFFAEMQKPAQEAMKLFADAQTKFFAQMPAQEATKAFAEMQKPALEAMKAFAEMQNSAQEAMKAFVEMQNSAQEAMKAFVEMQRPAQEAMNLFAEMQKPARQAMKFFAEMRKPTLEAIKFFADAPVGLSEWLKGAGRPCNSVRATIPSR